MTVIKFRPKNAPRTPTEELGDIDAVVHQMRKDDKKNAIKFGSIVILFVIAAFFSIGLGMSIAAIWGNEYMNDYGKDSAVPAADVP